MMYKNRWIWFEKEVNGDGVFLIYDSRTSKNIIGYTDPCRQALAFVDDLEKQLKLEIAMEKNFQ